MDLWKRNIHQYGVKKSYQLISHQVYLNLHFYFVSRSPTAWITVYVRESGDIHDQFIVYDQVSNRLTMNLGRYLKCIANFIHNVNHSFILLAKKALVYPFNGCSPPPHPLEIYMW